MGERDLVKNDLIIWRIFVFLVAFSLYFLNVISREILLVIVVGFFVFVMLPEIIVNVWKKRHEKTEEWERLAHYFHPLFSINFSFTRSSFYN